MLFRSRERPEDVVPLFRFFVKRFSQELGLSPVRLAADAELVLTGYRWPGNTRELQNVVQRCLALYYGQTITEEKLLTVLSPQGSTVPVAAASTAETLEAGPVSSPLSRRKSRQPLTAEEIQSALAVAGGSVGKAAGALGVHRSTLWRYLSPR